MFVTYCLLYFILSIITYNIFMIENRKKEYVFKLDIYNRNQKFIATIYGAMCIIVLPIFLLYMLSIITNIGSKYIFQNLYNWLEK